MPLRTVTSHLLPQLTMHWDDLLRPKLDGLSNEEYRWKPVASAWDLHARDDGTLMVDWDEAGEASPHPPVTTIAWRLGHVITNIYGMRNAAHFGGPPIDEVTYDYPATAAGALAALDEHHARWVANVESLGDEGLGRPMGEYERSMAALPMADLVLHIHREVIHHGAEALLLRDLFHATGGTSLEAVTG